MGNFLRSAAVLIIIVSTVVLQVLLTRYFPRLLLDLPLVAVLVPHDGKGESAVDDHVGYRGWFPARQSVARACWA